MHKHKQQEFRYRNSANNAIGVCFVEIVKRANKKTLVIVSETEHNPGMSICNAFEDLFVQVCVAFKLNPRQITWVEHWPAWSGRDEDWSFVDFCLMSNDFGLRPEAPSWTYLGSSREAALAEINW